MIDPAHHARLQKPYDDLVVIGLNVHPEQHKLPNKQGKPGRVKQSNETNLLRHLRDKREEVLRFMNDLQVPFDNNQAERYCVVSSYISTVREQGLNLIEAIKATFTGNPFRITTWIVTLGKRFLQAFHGVDLLAG